jgi:hypothetical protein
VVPPFNVANPCTEDSSTVHALLPELLEDELLEELAPLELELLDEAPLEDELDVLLDEVDELVELDERESSSESPPPLLPPPSLQAVNKMAITASAVSLQEYIVLSGHRSKPVPQNFSCVQIKTGTPPALLP